MIIPVDIDSRIDELFPKKGARKETKDFIEGLWKKPINVGPDQLARSILYLSNGNIEVIRKIFLSDFYGDPRNVIMEAEARAGHPGHYFIEPFDKIERLSDKR